MEKYEKIKDITLSSLFKNKDISKIIEEALSSSIGSTKRAKARAIIRVLKKTKLLPTLSKNKQLAIKKLEKPKEKKSEVVKRNRVFFPAVSVGKKKGADGKGGPGGVTGVEDFMGQPTAFQSHVSAAGNLVKDAPSGFQSHLQKYVYPKAYSIADTILNTAKLGASTALAVGEYAARAPYDYFTKPAGEGIKLKDTFGARVISDVNQFYPSRTPAKASPTAKPVPTLSSVSSPDTASPAAAPGGSSGTPGSVIFYDGKTYKYINKDGSIHEGPVNDGYEDKTSPTGASANGATGESGSNFWPFSISESTSESGATDGATATGEGATDGTATGNPAYPAGMGRVETLMRQGSEANLGPTMTSMRIMADKEAMKELFPGVPEDELPIGASLTAQMADLKDALKKEYQIDSLLDQSLKMKGLGANFIKDTQSYVRGRDEFLNKVDGMINSAEEGMLKADLANPEVAANYQKYLGYLNTLKGRQNQRYIDYVNTAIDEYNNDANRLNTLYQTNVQAFTDAFTTQGALTTETYNTLKTSLEEMYNSLPGEMIALQKEHLQAETDRTNAQTVLDVVSTSQKNNRINFIKDLPQYFNIVSTDGKGEVLSGDIGQMVNLANQQEGLSGEGVIFALSKKMADNIALSSSGNPDDKSRVGSDPVKLFNDYYSMISNYASSGEYGARENAQQLGSSLISNMEPVLRNQLKYKMDSIRKAVSSLVGEGLLKKPVVESTAKKWKEENSDLSPEILDYLFKYYSTNSSAGDKPSAAFTTVPDPETGEATNKGKISNVSDEELLDLIVPGITEFWKSDLLTRISE